MKILVIGGTAFVGRAIVLDAVERGHTVTVFNRGQTPAELPSSVERVAGDRDGDLTALSDRSFDATVDVIAYRPSAVDRLADALGDRGGHHLQISSVSAYEDSTPPRATEAEATLHPEQSWPADAPVTGATYGPLKADTERAAVRRFGDRTTIVRPTYVIGGHDLTLRFPYWVQRCRRGGRIAVPGPDRAVLQYIDARDLAAFCVGLLERDTAGAFHACGPFPEERFVATIARIAAAVAPAGAELVEVDAPSPEERHAPSPFPLWGGTEPASLMSLDPARAIDAGLRVRPLEESVDDVVAWWGDREWPEHWLSRDAEAELLATA